MNPEHIQNLLLGKRLLIAFAKTKGELLPCHITSHTITPYVIDVCIRSVHIFQTAHSSGEISKNPLSGIHFVFEYLYYIRKLLPKFLY